MPGIDDPIDAVKKQYPEHASNAVDVLLDVAAESHPFAGMANAIRKFFSKKEAKERVKALLNALEWYIREHEKRLDLSEKKLRDLSEKMNSPEFIEAVLVAANESLRTANLEKIKRFAKVLGHELIYGDSENGLEDASAYIRDLSEIGERDIKVLSILYDFQGNITFDFLSAGGGVPSLLAKMSELLIEARKRGIPREEFCLRCAKLGGFGLVFQIDKSRVNAQPDDFIFLLTSSGRKLIEILKK